MLTWFWHRSISLQRIVTNNQALIPLLSTIELRNIITQLKFGYEKRWSWTKYFWWKGNIFTMTKWKNYNISIYKKRTITLLYMENTNTQGNTHRRDLIFFLSLRHSLKFCNSCSLGYIVVHYKWMAPPPICNEWWHTSMLNNKAKTTCSLIMWFIMLSICWITLECSRWLVDHIIHRLWICFLNQPFTAHIFSSWSPPMAMQNNLHNLACSSTF